MMRQLAIKAHAGRPDAIRGVAVAIERFSTEGIEVVVSPGIADVLAPEIAAKCKVREEDEFRKLADMVMTFGGDGTLLAAARTLMGTDVPIMGVNVGKLGFLAEFAMSELDDAIARVISGAYRIVDRTTLEVTFGEVSSFALNEVLVERSSKAKMISVKAWVDDHHVADYRADGVIVATPTGSTAYSLAAGGPIIAPSTNSLCITPIAPHTLTLRPLIIDDTSEIRLQLLSEAATGQVVADGQILGVVDHDQTVHVRKSAHLVKLIKRVDSTYYDLLRQKLLWSVDPATK
ncbi:MAG: NAD(+) kinase [Candidatus Kapabacteria bacterium]|nr:NAD(+) kinase [Candidatus Kapabacteria bacterium]